MYYIDGGANMLTVVKNELRIKENVKNGKWQLVNVVLYSDGTCKRTPIKEYETYEKAFAMMMRS